MVPSPKADPTLGPLETVAIVVYVAGTLYERVPINLEIL
jgi:hypothetical protein